MYRKRGLSTGLLGRLLGVTRQAAAQQGCWEVWVPGRLRAALERGTGLNPARRLSAALTAARIAASTTALQRRGEQVLAAEPRAVDNDALARVLGVPPAPTAALTWTAGLRRLKAELAVALKAAVKNGFTFETSRWHDLRRAWDTVRPRRPRSLAQDLALAAGREARRVLALMRFLAAAPAG